MNKNALKIIILSITLVLPVLIFILLKTTGSNVYSLGEFDPLKNRKDTLNILNPASNNCPDYTKDNVHRIPPFSFINQDGVRFSSEQLAGKVYVADFFFTTCSSICIEMSSEMKRIQETFKNNPDIMLVSYTVNPENDTAPVLKQYAERYSADTKKWNFLTGNRDSIYNLAHCGYYILAKPNEKDVADFIHSDKLILVDKEKRIRGYYSGTDKEDIDRLIIEIQLLMREYL
jgi:protein SCO1/2